MPRESSPVQTGNPGVFRSWRAAFAAQASSDYRVFGLLRRIQGGCGLCHRLHFLQMAAEKLAKAFMAGSGSPGTRPAALHTAFTRFVQQAKQNREVRRRLGFESHIAYVKYIDSLSPPAKEVERLAPAIGGMDAPNVEYPWLQGTWIAAPISYPFSTIRLSSPPFVRLLQFMEVCLDVLEVH